MQFKEFLRMWEGFWFGNDESVTKFRRQSRNSDAESAYEKSKDANKKGVTQPKPPEPKQG
jgi:hypothetical protein